jgi:ABC-type metal ion transport system substrate-binding protein
MTDDDDDAVLQDLANLSAVLRSLERQGLIECRLGEDGQTRWHITAKGKNIDFDDIDGVEPRDFALD